MILSTLEGKNVLSDGANSLLSWPQLTILHSEQPKLYGVLAVLSANRFSLLLLCCCFTSMVNI